MGVVHHIRRRAGRLAAEIDCHNPDQLLNTVETAELLGHAPITLRSWRANGIGPPWIRTTRTAVRYRMGPLEWLWRAATYGRFVPIRAKI